jgi:competence transcription factor ComK
MEKLEFGDQIEVAKEEVKVGAWDALKMKKTKIFKSLGMLMEINISFASFVHLRTK